MTKKVLSLMLAVLLCATLLGGMTAALAADKPIAINKANFPDKVFRKYVKTEFDGDGDGKLSTAEREVVTVIDVGGKDEIGSLAGIEFFPNLQELFCYSNSIKKLDLSKNKKLVTVDAGSNALTSVDVGGCKKLVHLYVPNNSKLKKLDVSKNTKLTHLHCYTTKLEKLDVSKNLKLQELICCETLIKKVDVSKNTKLVYLDCSCSRVSSLTLPKTKTLTGLDCTANFIKKLDVTPYTRLTKLWCSENMISKLDLSKNTKLESLWAWGNKYKKLDLAKNAKLRKLIADQQPTLEEERICWSVDDEHSLKVSVNCKLTNGGKVLYQP